MSDEILAVKKHSIGASETGSETEGNHYYDYPGRIFEGNGQPGICGLSNLGNTCFMNSALQCLANVPQLVEFFVSGQYHSQINTGNKKTKGGAVAKEFGKLVQQIWCGESTCIAPYNFRSEITEIAPDFKGHYQQDTQEYTMFLLDGLHDDLNRAKKKQSLPNREHGREIPLQEVANAAWRKYKSDNDSIVTDLFHGQLKSTTICKNCQEKSVTFDPFCYLSLPLPLPPSTTKNWLDGTTAPKEQVVSISECLRNFTEPEQIERSCQCGFKSHEKILNIWRLPEILVVHLKRYQIVGSEMLKIGTCIEFALKNFILEDAIANSEEKHQRYELISATCHSGTLTDGHYTAWVLKNTWHSISDAVVTDLGCKNLLEASSRDVVSAMMEYGVAIVSYLKKAAINTSLNTKVVSSCFTFDVLYDVCQFLDKYDLAMNSTSSKTLCIPAVRTLVDRVFAILYAKLKDGVPPHKVIGLIEVYAEIPNLSTFDLYYLHSVRDAVLLKIVKELNLSEVVEALQFPLTPNFARKALGDRIKELYRSALLK